MTTLTATPSRRLLSAGLLAGPLFVGSGLAQAATRGVRRGDAGLDRGDRRLHPALRRPAAVARAGLTAAGVLGSLLVAAWPDPDGLSVRLVVASAVRFAVLAGLAANALGGDALGDEAGRA